MKKDRTERELAKRFRDFESPADFESAWGQIESKRTRKRKRRVFIWLLLAGLLALGSWVSIEYFIDNEDVAIAENKNLTIEPNENNSNHDLPYEKTPVNEKLLNDKIQPVSNNRNKNLNKTQNQINLNETGAVDSDLEKVSDTFKVSDNSESASPEEIKSVRFLNQKLSGEFKLLDIPETILNLPKTKIPETKIRKPIYQGFSLTYGKNIRQLKTDSEFEREWLDLRNELETPLDAIFGEYTFRKYLTKNLFFQTGLGIHQSTTRRTEIHDRIYTEIQDSHLIEIIIEEDGTQTPVYGAAIITFYETKAYSFYNRTRSVYVPILAGFDMPFKKKKSGLSLYGGFSVFLYSQMLGQPAKNEIFPNRRFEFRTFGVLNAQGNLDFYYQISPFVRVSGGIQSVLNINNWAKGTDYSEKYHILGLRGSVTHLF